MESAPRNRRVRWPLAVAALVVVAAATVGVASILGGGDKSSDPRQTLVDFYTAVAAGDPASACALMTRSAAAIRQAGVGDCAQSVRAFDALAGAFGGQHVLDKIVTAVKAARARMKVATEGDRAVVTLPGSSGSVRLQRVGARWLIDQSVSSLSSSTATPGN